MPAPLIAIVVLTGAAMLLHVNAPTVGDEGALPDSLPGLVIPQLCR